jgi:predicted RNase H-like nuclease
MLGQPRGSSVFPAPVRSAIRATTRLEASRLTQAADGRRVGAQAWGIHPKIAEVDEWLRSTPSARNRVREVHPELSFCALNGAAIREQKRSRAGRDLRRALIEGWLRCPVPGAQDLIGVGEDDTLDAFAALWTAQRIHLGVANSLPQQPQLDSLGLKMEIVY